MLSLKFFYTIFEKKNFIAMLLIRKKIKEMLLLNYQIL
jgi:hypothetical protein